MKKRILITCLALPILAGCIQPIVMDPMEENLPVVVNCVLRVPYVSVSAKQTLTLTYVKGKSQKEFIPVEDEDAVVYLEQIPAGGPHPEDIFFVRKEGCTWETERAIPITFDTKYTLRVEIPGRKPIWAETRTPPYVSPGTQEGEFACIYKIETKQELLRNCAMWITAYEITGPNSETSPLDYLTTDHPGVDGFNITGRKFSELSFRGEPDSPEDIAFKNEYDRTKEYLSDYPIYEKFLRIGQLDNPSSFFIYAGPMTNPYPWDVNGGRLHACAYLRALLLSEDLDKYLRSAYIYDISLSTDLTYLYSMSNDIYSNIHGGLGIFGSYCSVYGKSSFMRDFSPFPIITCNPAVPAATVSCRKGFPTDNGPAYKGQIQ